VPTATSPRHAVGLIGDAGPAADEDLAGGRARIGHSVHDYARRMAFLTELDSATWLARYSAAERLGDPDAVTSVAGYAAWLRRISAAWSAVAVPTAQQAAPMWPFASMPASFLDIGPQLETDLLELALCSGGPHGHAATRPVPLAGRVERAELDVAYVAGAAYVAAATGQEAAVLAADADHLSEISGRPLPRHYLQHSLRAASVRSRLRRELADWADAAGPQAAERAILTARLLLEDLAAALANGSRPGGW
jgi:hypothetical protein